MRSCLVALVALGLAGTLAGAGAARHVPVSCPPNVQKLTVVAARVIPKGTLGSEILKKRWYRAFKLPCKERKEDAFSSPAQIRALTTARDLFPGMQFAHSDFNGVFKLRFTPRVAAGSYASLTISVRPRTRCAIEVIYDTVVSSAKGLGPKRGGYITWRWRVATNTHAGRWPVTVRCGKSGLLKLKLSVVRA